MLPVTTQPSGRLNEATDDPATWDTHDAEDDDPSNEATPSGPRAIDIYLVSSQGALSQQLRPLFFFLSGGVTERTREAATHQNPASRRTERRTKGGQGRKRPAQKPRQKSGVLAQAADQTPLSPPTPP
jgi:hypothetical protein